MDATFFAGQNGAIINSGLTGVSNGPELTFSIWVEPDIPSGDEYLFRIGESGATQSRVALQRKSAGRLLLQSTSGVLWDQDFPEILRNVWTHILFSVDAANNFRHLYVNDAAVASLDAVTSGNIALTEPVVIGGTNGFGDHSEACLTQVWMTPSYIDLSVEANRRKFISADGKAVALGADGSLPTGTPPAIYCTGGAASIRINRGTGGNFSGNVDNPQILDCDNAPAEELVSSLFFGANF